MNKIDRQELINRYENIIKKWNNSSLKRLFPDKYKEIYMKLQILKAGLPYKTYDATDELKDMIMDMGAKMCGMQKMWLRNKKKKGVLKNHKKQKYEYKTDIPDFVDKVIENKLYNNK